MPKAAKKSISPEERKERQRAYNRAYHAKRKAAAGGGGGVPVHLGPGIVARRAAPVRIAAPRTDDPPTVTFILNGTRITGSIEEGAIVLRIERPSTG